MNKKAIAILGAIFLLIVGTLGFLIFSKNASKTTTPPTTTVTTSTPVATNPPPVQPAATSTPPNPVIPPASGAVLLTSDRVISPALSFSGDGVTYLNSQGNLYQSTIQNNNGQLALVSKKQLDIPQKANVSKVLWPSRNNIYDFIAESDMAGKPSFSYFNGQKAAYIDLPPQVESLDWLPSGTQIVYVWVDNGKAILSQANPDTKNFQKLADMWETDDILRVSPDGSQILYYEAAGSPNNAINSVSIDGKVWKGLVKTGQNYGVLWSPDSQKFLFAKKDVSSQQYQLWYYNLTSGEVRNLQLFTTTDKVAWANDSQTIYAAVPSSGMAVPEGLPGGGLTNDSFYSLNIVSNNKKQFTTGSTPIDGRNLFLSGDGNFLFFKNAQDGGLYYLNLN